MNLGTQSGCEGQIPRETMERYYSDLATAFVRGRLGNPLASIEDGIREGLRLHKFKQNIELPRVKRILGILRGLAPENLLDVGSGRGTFPTSFTVAARSCTRAN